MSRIRANKITNQAADGAPTVENGLIISGVTTVTGSINNLNLTGITTISTLDLNGDLDVDGHTNLDNVSIAGVSTISNNLFLKNDGAYIDFKQTDGTQTGYIQSRTTDFRFHSYGARPVKFGTNDTERLRIGTDGQIGIAGANYGSSGQVLTSGGSGSSVSWSTINSDAINEGNTKAEVIDSGSDGRFIVETEGTQRLRVDSNGLGISSTTTAARNAGVSTAIGTIIFNSTTDQLQVYGNKQVWKGFSPLDPTLTNISGTLYASYASTLTLTGTNFLTQNLQVRFVQATRSVNVTVTVTPSSNTAASVAVPATVYNNVQGGDAVTISVTNSDNNSSDGLNITASALPTGGNITTSGSYRIHTFTSGGDFVVPSGLTLSNVEYLIVAGGGGGGPSNNGHQGGGGGAGGLRTSVVGATSGRGTSAETRLTYTAGTYAVSVGPGGGSRNQGGGDGYSGTNSSLATTGSTITSVGGGGGGMGQNNGASRAGVSGGCGGGAGSSDQSPLSGGSGTAGQGYDGGNATCQGCGRGGGGGGAAADGTNGAGGSVGSSNTAGGAGLANSITGSSVTYATGGDCPGTSGTDQNPGAANTGNGGDGGYSHNNSPTGQAGGSGIVIVRYTV